ncbi:ribonuclease H-like domain-containing protein [Tanacetum coccineum]|uniref:Ribonuclease H-like domain-containing protein n=1 Tax=Tanacetum coccineum TaxID=301880 RepID=A0ABQ5J1Q4_9ASTR
MAFGDDINKSGDDSNKKHDDIGFSSELNLSFGDTLYLYPYDTGGSPIVTIKLTRTENYKMWCIAMTFALRNHNKFGFIDGSCNKDNKNPTLANQWDMYESYLAIRSNTLTREPLPLVKEAFAIVSGEESYRNATSIRAIKPTATAFAAKTFDNKRRFNNNNNFNKGSSSNSNFNNRGPNPNMKCTNCNKIGHTVDKWFELIGYLVGYVKRNFNANTRTVSSNNASPDVHSNNASTDIRNNNSFASLSNEQISRLMSHLNDNGASSANDNMAGHPNGTQALITKIGDLKIIMISLYMMFLLFLSTLSLWHQRLGHLADQVLDVLKS